MKHSLYALALCSAGLAAGPVAAAGPESGTSANEVISMSTQSGAGNWVGAYVSGTLSYASTSALYCDGFGDGDRFDCDNPGSASDGLPEPQPSGAMFGVTAGHDWQNGSVVYGVAGDLMFGNLSDVVGSTTEYGCGDGGCGLEINSIAMLRGRLGYDMGVFLPYATLGFALTQATAGEPGERQVDDSFTNTVLGVGADYRINETMSAGFEVLHLFKGDDAIINNDFCTDCGPTGFSATLARVTLSYRF